MKKSILSVFLLISILSCTKENKDAKDSNTNNLSTNYYTLPYNLPTNVYGLVNLLSQSLYDPYNLTNPVTSFSVSGSISNYYWGYSTTNLDAGNFTIAGQNIYKDSKLTYRDTINNGPSLFGTNTNFSFSGNANNGINPINETLYIPHLLILTSGPTSINISKSAINKFTWSPDNQNQTDKVYIKIEYKSTFSRFLDSTLTASEIMFQEEVLDANGEYTIPQNILNSLPIGGYIDIAFARGNYKIGAINSTQNIIIIAGSTIDRLFKMTN
jgi:hypothetical protein